MYRITDPHHPELANSIRQAVRESVHLVIEGRKPSLLHGMATYLLALLKAHQANSTAGA